MAAAGSRRKPDGAPAGQPGETRNLAAGIVRATEAERRRIAREIHDQLGPMLTALHFDIVRLRKRLAAKERPEALLEEVDAISGFIGLTLEGVRRIATELRPPLLDEVGLAAAIEWQAQEFTRRTGIPARVARPVEEPALADEVSSAMFRIFQELLTNVARHAGAGSVEIHLGCSGHLLELEVQDDGRGFRHDQQPPQSSLGLLGIRERVLLLGGEVTIDAQPGRGAAVKVRIPLNADSAR